MELHERVSVLPVTTGLIATISEGDMHIGVVNQCVGERHGHRAGTYNKVVSLQRTHHHWPLNSPSSRTSDKNKFIPILSTQQLREV